MEAEKRIEKAVIAMFELDRLYRRHTEFKVLDGLDNFVKEQPDLCDIALALLDTPEDTWGFIATEAEYEAASKERYCFSWDSLIHAWAHDCKTGEEFLAFYRQWMDELREEEKKWQEAHPECV